MAKELLVNVSRGEEVRVALVEDGELEELYLERDNAASNVGNIYLGKVTNVEGSIQAAFIDFGYGRNGFLHVQDLHPDYFPEGGRWDSMVERVGKKIGRRDRPPIQDSLRRGDQIIVQIIKEGIGTKGPTLTSYPSIPGRFLVMMPGVQQMGVSKNIEDETERRRLRKVLDGLKPPKNVGFIIRTAGMGKTKAELERDFKYLTRLYEQIEHTRKTSRAPALLYSEGDLVTRTVRDVWTSDIDRVVVDDVETALRIKQFFKLLMPRTNVSVDLYRGNVPLFHAAGIEHEVETMFSRHVPLKSGGSLVIDSTEAIVAIDVNSGKFREHADAEETAFRIDLEAADEICRQLRLRDLGGVVICDFIDLRYARHRQALFDRLTENFKRDRAKSRHLEMNEFGIVSITRQRMRPDLKKSVYMPCPWSNGTGFIKTPESMALDVMRRLRVAASDDRVRRIAVGLYPSVALHLMNAKRRALADLETSSGKMIVIREDPTLAADAVALELFDDRDVQVKIESLDAAAVSKPDEGGKRRRRRRRRGGEEAAPQPQKQGQPARHETDARGLVELPTLLPLGDKKLQEVEALVLKLLDEEAAQRQAAERDPTAAIISALESQALDEQAEEDAAEELAAREEAVEDEERVAEGAAPVGDDAAATGEEEGTRRRRRRRRRRGGRDRDEVVDEKPASAAPPEEARRAEQRPAAREQKQDRPPRKPQDRPAAAPSAPAAPAAPGAAEVSRDAAEGRRRRRKGRGLRGRLVTPGVDADGAVRPHRPIQPAPGSNGRAVSPPGKPAAPAASAKPSETPRHRPAETPRQSHEEAAAESAASAPGAEKAAEGSRRRRNRGRKVRGRPLVSFNPAAQASPSGATPAARTPQASAPAGASVPADPPPAKPQADSQPQAADDPPAKPAAKSAPKTQRKSTRKKAAPAEKKGTRSAGARKTAAKAPSAASADAPAKPPRKATRKKAAKAAG